MGNMMESDGSSGSDSEIIEGVRTDGDGMEMQKQEEHLLNTHHISNQSHQPSHPYAVAKQGSSTVYQIENSQCETSVIGQCVGNSLDITKEVIIVSSSCSKAQSPKEFPPDKKLISLKPIRLGEKGLHPSEASEQYSMLSQGLPTKKQREPRFVPYEPYVGAIRPIQPIKISSNPVKQVPLVSSINPRLEQKINVVESSVHLYKKESSHVALLKEQLRIAHKDIEELRLENIRIKRLLVDSLVGPSPDYNGNNNHDIQESIQQLSDEIEVWRSKFLSSCVLVEQLSKEKENLVESTAKANDLFKDIKSRVDLTPDLYEGIRCWTLKEEKENLIRKEASFSSLDDL